MVPNLKLFFKKKYQKQRMLAGMPIVAGEKSIAIILILIKAKFSV